LADKRKQPHPSYCGGMFPADAVLVSYLSGPLAATADAVVQWR
jgi:hypothetical protein